MHRNVRIGKRQRAERVSEVDRLGRAEDGRIEENRVGAATRLLAGLLLAQATADRSDPGHERVAGVGDQIRRADLEGTRVDRRAAVDFVGLRMRPALVGRRDRWSRKSRRRRRRSPGCQQERDRLGRPAVVGQAAGQPGGDADLVVRLTELVSPPAESASSITLLALLEETRSLMSSSVAVPVRYSGRRSN